jgi:hypothetical protein
MWPVVLRWENGSKHEDERLESGCVWWIMRVLSSRLYRVVGRQKADNQGEGGNDGGTLMAPVMRDRNGEGKTMGCSHFQKGRRGGDEATPRYPRQMT